MSQGDILEVLEKSKRPMSASDIALALNERDKHVFISIRRLIKSNSIKILEIDREQALKLYKCKRRMRLYYI